MKTDLEGSQVWIHRKNVDKLETWEDIGSGKEALENHQMLKITWIGSWKKRRGSFLCWLQNKITRIFIIVLLPTSATACCDCHLWFQSWNPAGYPTSLYVYIVTTIIITSDIKVGSQVSHFSLGSDLVSTPNAVSNSTWPRWKLYQNIMLSSFSSLCIFQKEHTMR